MDRYVFFGGKGGVGKTTVSSAYAHECARDGVDTLLVSTDPAHSTADVFDQAFGDEPTAVDGYEALSVLEIDPEAAVDDHLMGIKQALGDQVSPALVNEIDRQIELAHRTPGAHEAALFDRFVEVMRDADQFDRVVFDTSPTGGTLRLLSLPEYLQGWIDRLVEKREESMRLFERAALGDREPRRSRMGDPILQRLRERKDTFEFAGETLRSQAAFYLVLNPDQLSVRETRRTIESLEEQDLDVDGLVANRLTPSPGADEDGRGARYLRERVRTERDRIDTVQSSLSPPLVGQVESRVREVKGDLLETVAAELDVPIR
jgi:arsenite-transporting ATPase